MEKHFMRIHVFGNILITKDIDRLIEEANNYDKRTSANLSYPKGRIYYRDNRTIRSNHKVHIFLTSKDTQPGSFKSLAKFIEICNKATIFPVYIHTPHDYLNYDTITSLLTDEENRKIRFKILKSCKEPGIAAKFLYADYCNYSHMPMHVRTILNIKYQAGYPIEEYSDESYCC